jgi:hypothetical protein
MRAQLPPEIVVGDPAGDHLAIRVLGRLHPGSDDFWDGNWLATPIKAAVGGFRATVGASLRADELQTLLDALKGLHSALNGEAVLESMEKWLTLRMAATNRGRLEVKGTLLDRAGDGNQLTFRIDGLDQSYLPNIIDSLEGATKLFPVLGSTQPGAAGGSDAD